MENQSLKDYALFCECAERAARFGILLDFIKKGVTDFYTFKSRKQELASDEMDVFMDKYRELQLFVNEITPNQ